MHDKPWHTGIPWEMLVCAAALVALGLSGIARCETWTETGSRFLKQQLVWTVVGVVAILLAATPNYRILLRWSYPAFGLTIVLLTAVFFFRPVNGAQRWLRLGPVSLQPSELAKIALVVVLARYLMHRENHRRLGGLWVPLALTFLPMVLILREPDLGTALVFLPVLLLMLLAAGARKRDLLALALAGLMTTPVLWSQMSREQRSRVTAMLQQTGAGEQPTSDGYHLHQAKRLIALGGWTGSATQGDAVDDIAAFRVPEPHTDSIFPVLGERFGICGMSLVLGLYLVLGWRGLAIADRTREPFGRLVAVGLSSLILIQAIINTGMMVGLLPITGLALPLVSYGGSSMLANCIALGMLVNISRRPGYEMSDAPFRFSGAI